MTKENILFVIIGILGGFIAGFMFANNVNQNGVRPAATTTMNSNSAIPPGHPEVGGNSGEIQQVQAAIDKAKAEPDNFEAQIKAAEMFYQTQKFDGAIEFLKQANKIKPDDYETIVNLGNSYFDATKYEEAEKWYTAALVKKTDDINVRTDLGLTFIFRQPPNYDRAIQEFTKTLEKDPNHPQALQNLTVAYTKKGDTGKAKETLSKLESLDATNPAIGKLREDIENPGLK
jgi:tetratricopeptide (TPR) repeat protein